MQGYLFWNRRKQPLALVILVAGMIMFVGLWFVRSNHGGEDTREPTTMPTITPNPQRQPINVLDANWQYVPGVTLQGNNLIVTPLNRQIVGQDGLLVQQNPPVSVFGPQLTGATNEYSLSFGLREIDAGQVIRLYGTLPIVADEFMIPGSYLELKFSGDQLEVNTYVSRKSEAQSSQTFVLTDPATSVLVAHMMEQFDISINGEYLGKLYDPGVADVGNLWFGFDSLQGEWQINSFTTRGSDIELRSGLAQYVHATDQMGLQALAANKREGFMIGTAIAPNLIASDAPYRALALDSYNFGSITPENAMKMINLQPQRGVYSFEEADGLVQVALQNGLTVHGHALVFGEANPTWVTQLPVSTQGEKDAIAQVMIDHVRTVVSHFGSKINSWDVINEPLADYDDFESGQTFRNHVWYQAMGKEYIIQALKVAHEANPEATLFINDYGLESDGERFDMIS